MSLFSHKYNVANSISVIATCNMIIIIFLENYQIYWITEQPALTKEFIAPKINFSCFLWKLEMFICSPSLSLPKSRFTLYWFWSIHAQSVQFNCIVNFSLIFCLFWANFLGVSVFVWLTFESGSLGFRVGVGDKSALFVNPWLPQCGFCASILSQLSIKVGILSATESCPWKHLKVLQEFHFTYILTIS